MTVLSPADGGAFDHHRGRKPLLRQTSSLRGFFFVGTTLAGFCAINAFMHYLATGEWFAFSAAAYQKALGVPLSQMLVRPLSIFTHPWMVVVTGILLAAVIFTPAMLAVLYRVWVSMAFALVVALVGHAPLLAAFQVVGCALASQTRIRSDMPFLSFLAGLAPPAVYLYFFSGSVEGVSAPLGKLVFYFPFILALVSALAAGAVVLLLTRLTKFRPGVVWPIMLVFLVAPVWLFYQKVGPSELEYALLTGDIAAGEGIFPPQTVGDFLESLPARPASEARGDKGKGDARPVAPAVDADEADVLPLARRELTRRQEGLVYRCNRFLERWPWSSRVPAVMWLRSAAMDLRLDTQALGMGLVKYISPGPCAESVGGWTELAEGAPLTPQAMVANERLGICALRDGRMDQAMEFLTSAGRLRGYLARPKSAKRESVWDKVFVPTEMLPGEEYYRAVLDETNRILWIIDRNKVLTGPKENVAAFAEYMRHWPFLGERSVDLECLAERFADTMICDNFLFEAAMAQPHEMERAIRLAKIAERVYENGQLKNEAAVEANYHLGKLALRLGGEPAWSANKLKTAREYFEVVMAVPGNPYIEAAKGDLAWLATSRQAATRPAKKH
jgi:hypothetical protein